MFGPVLLEKCCTAAVMYATRHHNPFAIAFPLIEANLTTFALYSGVNFKSGHFFCGFLASASYCFQNLFVSFRNRHCRYVF